MAQKNMGQPENLAVDALVGGTVSSPVGLLGPHFSESICLEVAQQDTHTHTHIIRIIYNYTVHTHTHIYIYIIYTCICFL